MVFWLAELKSDLLSDLSEIPVLLMADNWVMEGPIKIGSTQYEVSGVGSSLRQEKPHSDVRFNMALQIDT